MRPRAYWVPLGNCKTASVSRARTSTAVRIAFDEKDPPPAKADYYPNWRQSSRRRRHGGGHNSEHLGNIIEPLDAVPQGRGSGLAVAFATHEATQLRHDANGFMRAADHAQTKISGDIL